MGEGTGEGFPLTLEQAREHREAVMEGVKAFIASLGPTPKELTARASITIG